MSQPLNLLEKRISANGADKTVRAKAEKEEPWEEKQRGASRPVNQYSSFKQHKGLPVQIWKTREIFSLSDMSYFLSDAVVSTTAEKKVGEESLFHLTSAREVRPATWRLGPKQRPQWNATYQLAPYASLMFLFYFYATQDHLPRTGTTTVVWVLLHQLLIYKMPSKLAYRSV